MAAQRLVSLALVGILLVIGSVQAFPANSRIWGGSDVTTGQHSYVVSVRVNNAHKCVGSLISDRHVLTAGHCVSLISTTSYTPSAVTVRVGSVNQYAAGEIVETDSIAIHPSYGNFLNDLAIITLKKFLTFTSKVNKIALAPAKEEYDEGTKISVIGWGVQQDGSTPYKLQQASMAVLSSSDCEEQAGFGYDSVICLQHPVNTGICRGDDGAGIVSGQKLIGVASFAWGGCGTKYPDISGKISFFREWIDSIIG